jgi:hypothetical protein
MGARPEAGDPAATSEPYQADGDPAQTVHSLERVVASAEPDDDDGPNASIDDDISGGSEPDDQQ